MVNLIVNISSLVMVAAVAVIVTDPFLLVNRRKLRFWFSLFSNGGRIGSSFEEASTMLQNGSEELLRIS